METHDHQSPADAAKPQEPSSAPTENKADNTSDAASQFPDSTAQAMSDKSTESHAQGGAADPAQSASIDPSGPSAIPDQQGPTLSQQSAQAAGQQAQFQPNVIMDPATGQLYYAMPQGQPVQPNFQNGQYVYYTTQAPPEPAPAAEPRQPDYAQIVKSVEDFAEGDASVADVVKTLWTETSQDDQFWKGAVVGAAAAFLLTSGPVRGAMGKTFGSFFGKNAADAADASAATPPGPDVNMDAK